MNFATFPVTNYLNKMSDFAMGNGLDPKIFIIMFFGSGILIILSMHILFKAKKGKLDKKYITPTILVFAFCGLLPYFYVLFWSNNINQWTKTATIIFIVATIFVCYRRVHKFKIVKRKEENL